MCSERKDFCRSFIGMFPNNTIYRHSSTQPGNPVSTIRPKNNKIYSSSGLTYQLVGFAIFFLLSIPVIALAGGIRDTKHNLSGSLSKWPGKFTVKAVDEPEICIFCHTPHNATPAQPLWNHELSGVTNYINYWSNTLASYSSEAEAPPIDGYSKLCLSCHDGTVAVGSVQSRTPEILMEASECVDGSGKLIVGGECSGYIGTDLSGGHPISIVYNQSLVDKRNGKTNLCQLNPPPSSDPDVKLYSTQGGQRGVQCTSCHDPHTNKSAELKDGQLWPPFWQKPSYNDVCYVCHKVDCGEPTEIWPW